MCCSEAVSDFCLADTLSSTNQQVACDDSKNQDKPGVSASPPQGYDSFCYHTNKGGVGKTTLCFHTLLIYAESNPDTLVVALDCDPQANLSSTLLTHLVPTKENAPTLGSEVAKQYMSAPGGPDNKTLMALLVGYNRNQTFTADELLIDVHAHNPNIPENVRLLCGDRRTDAEIPELQSKASGPVSIFGNPWLKVRSVLRNFCETIVNSSEVGPGKKYQKVVVFFDTSPSTGSLLTEMALCASHKVVVPLNADDYSREGIENMLNMIYGMYQRCVSEEKMFHGRVQQYDVHVAKLHGFINNKSVMQNHTVDNVFSALQGKIADAIHKAYMDAIKQNVVQRIFNGPSDPAELADADDFRLYFTGTMRDMQSCGAASIHSGLPLWHLKKLKTSIQKELNTQSNLFASSANSLADIIGPQRSGERTLHLTKTAANANDKKCLMSMLLRPDKADLVQAQEIGLSEEQHSKIWTEFNLNSIQAAKLAAAAAGAAGEGP